MSADTTAKAAAAALGEANARALRAFADLPESAPVRTALPHPFSNMSRAEWARSISLWRAHSARLLNDLPARPCPACGGVESDYIFDSYDSYPHHECRECRTLHVPLTVTHDLFERYFETVPEARRYGDYTDAQAVDTAALDADRGRFVGYYAALKTCLAHPGLSTLDIGCRVANFLAVVAYHGTAAEGIKVNRHKSATDLDADMDCVEIVAAWESLP